MIVILTLFANYVVGGVILSCIDVYMNGRLFAWIEEAPFAVLRPLAVMCWPVLVVVLAYDATQRRELP